MTDEPHERRPIAPPETKHPDDRARVPLEAALGVMLRNVDTEIVRRSGITSNRPRGTVGHASITVGSEIDRAPALGAHPEA